MKRPVGSIVYLRPGGYGGLSSGFLYDHGITDKTPVEIAGPGKGRYTYQVRLSDGYLLDVDEKDFHEKPQS